LNTKEYKGDYKVDATIKSMLVQIYDNMLNNNNNNNLVKICIASVNFSHQMVAVEAPFSLGLPQQNWNALLYSWNGKQCREAAVIKLLSGPGWSLTLAAHHAGSSHCLNGNCQCALNLVGLSQNALLALNFYPILNNSLKEMVSSSVLMDRPVQLWPPAICC
jgi:hypothetical protein